MKAEDLQKAQDLVKEYVENQKIIKGLTNVQSLKIYTDTWNSFNVDFHFSEINKTTQIKDILISILEGRVSDYKKQLAKLGVEIEEESEGDK